MGCDFWQVDDLQVSIYASRHKLLVFREEVAREYIRQNLFEPYVGGELSAIIRIANALKTAGEPVSIPRIVSDFSKGRHHGDRLR